MTKFTDINCENNVDFHQVDTMELGLLKLNYKSNYLENMRCFPTRSDREDHASSTL